MSLLIQMPPSKRRADTGSPAGDKEDVSTPDFVPGDEQLRSMIADALPEAVGLTPLSGFKMDLSGNPGFRKVFFSARCDCGTAALLSVEVEGQKTVGQISQALPSLVERLVGQAESFHGMSCDVHLKMRMGPAATS